MSLKQDQRYRAASLQEQGIRHRPSGDPLHNCKQVVITNFSPAGSVLSRNHGLATIAHERLEWTLVDQPAEQSETEWLFVEVAGYKIINVYKPLPSRLTPTAIPTFQHPSLYSGDFNCQHVN